MARPHDIQQVVAGRLCTGCGACAYVQPDAIRMVDDLDRGRRPVVVGGADTGAAFAVCPGAGLAHDEPGGAGGAGGLPELATAWGPVLEVWEGHATDPAIRYAGSSGGAATALALHCLDHEGMAGVVHSAPRADVPYLNHTVISRDRAALLAATGSRYAPASPCDGLDLVEHADGPCVFIGKPCDVAATQRARRVRPALDDRLGLVVAFFCAGTPSTRGTLEMFRRMGVDDPAAVLGVRYRGNGWPGMAEARTATGTRRLTYEQSWDEILQRHRQWRCYVCADHTGEFADVAVGDPWYRAIEPDEPGLSLVLVRTVRGRDIVRRATEAGALTLERRDPQVVPASQPNLLRARGAVWGRTAALRLLGQAAPRYTNLPTFAVWWRHLTIKQKAQSVAGTARRVLTRRLYRDEVVVPYER